MQENELILTFRAASEAIAAEKSLIELGVGARVMPLPSTIAEGCGICIRIDDTEFAQAHAALTQNGITPKAIWRRESQGFSPYLY